MYVVNLTMTLLTLRLIIIILSQLLTFQEATLTINQVIVSANDPQEASCLSVKNREKILSSINDNIMEILEFSLPQCGDGLWYRVAYLNVMSDTMQQCPSNWMERSTRVRACGRPTSTGPGVRCLGEYFSTRGVQYGKVCGRIIGYQEGSADTFERFGPARISSLLLMSLTLMELV
jgi:hypothetical protein